jgi:hypothetical protein
MRARESPAPILVREIGQLASMTSLGGDTEELSWIRVASAHELRNPTVLSSFDSRPRQPGCRSRPDV